MNILHTLPLPRSTWRLAALLCLLLAVLTLSPTLVSANSPPGTPSSVTVTRAEGMLTATWPAVASATGYDITYSSDGEKWAVAALNYSKATITFRVKNSATYVVAVRALNAHGDSSWRKSSPSGPFVQTNPPEAPSSVTLTRSVGTLTATWPAVSDAADYHVTYTWNGGKSWNLAAINYPGTSITIINASNVSTYMVAVRARNSAGYSDWRSSDPIAPISPPVLVPSGLTATADDKSVTLKWRGSSESRVAGYEYQYRQATGGTGWSAWTPVPGSTISTTSFTKTGLTNDIEYRFKLRAVNADGAGPPAPQKPPFYVAATPFSGVTIPTPPGPPPPLAPEWVSVTRADGTLTATWPARERAYAYHIAYTSDSGSSWTLAALYHPATTITIDGVSNNATYVVAVRARGDNGDSDWTRSAPIAPLTPITTPTTPPNSTTTDVSVGNLDETTGLGWQLVGQNWTNNQKVASGFTTGANTGGYSLKNVTVRIISVVGSPTGYTAAIHTDSSGSPAATSTYTLTGNAPTGAGDYTYTCSGTCTLEPDTKYFLVVSGAGDGSGYDMYEHRTTSSNAETNVPSNAGWSIDNLLQKKTNNDPWTSEGVTNVLKFKVSANVKTQGSPNMNATLLRGD